MTQDLSWWVSYNDHTYLTTLDTLAIEIWGEGRGDPLGIKRINYTTVAYLFIKL